jgi:hypothetical protein
MLRVTLSAAIGGVRGLWSSVVPLPEPDRSLTRSRCTEEIFAVTLDLFIVGARRDVLWIFVDENEIVRSSPAESRFCNDAHRHSHLPRRLEKPEKIEEIFVPLLAPVVGACACQQQQTIAAALAGEVSEVVFVGLAGALDGFDESFADVRAPGPARRPRYVATAT